MTTVLTGPGSANPISGQFVAMKTAGRWLDDMVIKAPAAMKLALGENPKLTYHERRGDPQPAWPPLPSSGRIWPRQWSTGTSWSGRPDPGGGQAGV